MAYFSLILMLGISGKRTLFQIKESGFIVTVALGSTLATVLLSKEVTLSGRVIALALLIFLQYILAASDVRSKCFSKQISSEPTLIFFEGNLVEKALKKERVTEAEVSSILRSQQVTTLEEVEAVVMESNGQFSIIKNSSSTDPGSLLFNVKKLE